MLIYSFSIYIEFLIGTMKLMHALFLLLWTAAWFFRVVPVHASLLCSVSADSLYSDSVAMRELVVSARRKPVWLEGDTLVFDVASFHVSDGGKLKELLKELPGIEVMNDGRIVANGKEVVRILLNGKDFFKDNKQVVLENIPAEILSEIKLYRKQTEQEERTGVALGDGEQVIDVQTLPDKDNGWFGDLVGAGGSEKRFVGNLSLSQFNDKWQNMISTTADNLPSSFGLGDSYTDKLYRAPNISDADKRSFNAIVTRMNEDWEVSGTFYYNKGRVKSGQQTFSENYLQQPASFIESRSKGSNESNSLSSTVDIRKRSDRLTCFLSPSMTYNKASSEYQYVSVNSQWTDVGDDETQYSQINRNDMNDEMYNRVLSLSLSGGLNLAFNKKGRNLDFTFNLSYGNQEEHYSSQSTVFYNLLEKNEKTFRFSDNPADNNSFRFQILYTEPVAEHLKLQVEYNIQQDRDEVNQYVTDLDELLGQKPGVIDWLPSDSLSKYADTKYLMHTCRAVLQYADGPLRMTAGVLLAPQTLKLNYRKNRHWIDTLQQLTSVAPELVLYYRKPNSWNWSFSYFGRNEQPSIFSLLPIMDDTNPLRCYMGNAGLRPTFNHSLTTTFFSFQIESQRQVNLSVNIAVLQNDVTQKTYYNEQTGSSLTIPENVSGNWNLGSQMNFSTSFVAFPQWYLEWQEEFAYTRRKAFQTIVSDDGFDEASSAYRVDTYTLTHYLAVQYKWRFLDVKPYSYMTCRVQNSELDLKGSTAYYRFGYGAMLRYNWAGGIDIALDIYNNCRRGFMDASLNGDEFVCDLEFSYTFLKDKSAEIRFQAFDLFDQVRTVNGTSDVTSRSEIHYNEGVNSYFLLGFTYRFGLFGKRR